MEYKKCIRKGNAKEFEALEWRLASVEEVERDMSAIRENKTVGSGDMALRLLDGCLDVTGGGCSCVQEYRPNMKHMLLITDKTISKKSEIDSEVNSSRAGKEHTAEIYSEVKSSRKGREVGLLLSCEDRIAEVILFVLRRISQEFSDRRESRKELDGLMKSVEQKFRGERTVMHYAAEDQSHKKDKVKNMALETAKFLVEKFEGGKELVKARDKYGTTALHLAAFHGNTGLCKYLIEGCEMKADQENQNGENLLHFAVRGKTSKEFKELGKLPGVKETIDSEDAQGGTALHKAAARGKTLTKIDFLWSNLAEHKRRRYICQGDLLGQTALHEAVRRGHLDVATRLLKLEKELLSFEETGSLLLESNSDGKTALHYAVELSDGQIAMDMTKLLLEGCKSVDEKYLLLWASATSMGTVEEYLKRKREKQGEGKSIVEEYLENERKKAGDSSECNLLQSAIKLGHFKMACELVNRGADPDSLTSFFKGRRKEENRAKRFLKQIHEMPERGRDQPTISDGLGRKHFANGLAALFLNPCVKTPLTVGILGDWGMGKSSLMMQIETILLKMAAQLVFPNLILTEEFPGSIEIKLSLKGQIKYEKIEKAVKDLKIDDLADTGEDPLVHFLDNYQEKYQEVYRALALMDRREMYHMEKSDSNSNRYSIINIPSILTVRYNAWQYQNEREAWAGLAVEIPKAIEESMTRAQRIRCRCKYAWTEHRTKMILELILPCFLAVLLAGLVLWGSFSRWVDTELIPLKYGSIPLTMVLVIWTILKQVNSVIKPVSAQIMGYLSVPDHSRNLGYQNQVISDIKFSKEEFGKKPGCFWKFIACLWSLCSLSTDNVKDTSIQRSPPPGKDDVRIIVFVDDLDRCKDRVILEVLSAVNLVLTVCGINVILGLNKEMITRALENQLEGNKIDAGLAEKYLSKIIHLPLALPDSNNDEIEEFVNQQLGPDFQRLGNDDDDSNLPKQESSEINQDGTGCHYAVNIDGNGCHCALRISPCCNESCRNFSSKVVRFLVPLTRFLCRLFHRKPGPENRNSNRRLSTPLKMMMLLPTYSPKERHAIIYLSKVAEGFGRLPREWKRFLIYHRVAWNVLCQDGKVRQCAGWQVQLIVWIFCCWQWKDQINKIIENWKKLVPVDGRSINKETTASGGDEDNLDDEEEEVLSLKSIVLHFIEETEAQLQKKTEVEADEVQADEETEAQLQKETEVDMEEVQAEDETDTMTNTEEQSNKISKANEVDTKELGEKSEKSKKEKGRQVKKSEVDTEELGKKAEKSKKKKDREAWKNEVDMEKLGEKAEKSKKEKGERTRKNQVDGEEGLVEIDAEEELGEIAENSKKERGSEMRKNKVDTQRLDEKLDDKPNMTKKQKGRQANKNEVNTQNLGKKDEKSKKEKGRQAKKNEEPKGNLEVIKVKGIAKEEMNVKEKAKGDKEEEELMKGGDKENAEKWEEFKNTLIKYDVSIQCILAFQKFRFYCKVKNLLPPANCDHSNRDC